MHRPDPSREQMACTIRIPGGKLGTEKRVMREETKTVGDCCATAPIPLVMRCIAAQVEAVTAAVDGLLARQAVLGSARPTTGSRRG